MSETTGKVFQVQKYSMWLPVTQEQLDQAEEDFCWMFDLDPLIHSAKYVAARSGRIWRDLAEDYSKNWTDFSFGFAEEDE